MLPNPQETEKTLNGRLHFLCSAISCHWCPSITTESLRKQEIFLCFQGVYTKSPVMLKWVY